MVILIWTYSLALTTPPIFGWGRYVVEVPNIRYVLTDEIIQEVNNNARIKFAAVR